LLSVTIPNPYFTVDSGLGSKFSQARARGLYQFSDKSILYFSAKIELIAFTLTS
jgi:hypothetical protein